MKILRIIARTIFAIICSPGILAICLIILVCNFADFFYAIIGGEWEIL